MDSARAAEIQRFLGEISALLADSLEGPATLQRIARLCVPLLADHCIVDLIDAEGDASVASVHVDPAREQLLHAMVVRNRPAPGAPRHGVSAERVVQPLVLPEVPDTLLQAMARDAEHLATIRLLAPKSVIVVPLVARGRALGAMMLVSSESDRRYDEEDLRIAQEVAQRAALAVDNARLYEEARAAIRVRDEVLAFVSHDLKAPLSSIKLHVEMLQELEAAGDTADRLRRLGRLDALTHKMERLIDELMDIARLQLDQELVLECAPTDVVALAQHVVAEHQALTECHTLAVVCDEPHLVADVDPARLGRVLDNLVGNAVKYSPEGGAITVRIRRLLHRAADPDREQAAADEQTHDLLELSVTDQGIGIPHPEQERIFRRFYRASNVAGRFAGAGIGLAGARQIVERHGGSIDVSSTEGDGSTFRVRLPLNIPAPSPDARPAAPLVADPSA